MGTGSLNLVCTPETAEELLIYGEPMTMEKGSAFVSKEVQLQKIDRQETAPLSWSREGDLTMVCGERIADKIVVNPAVEGSTVYFTSDSAVAQVNPFTGEVTAVGEGEAVITAAADAGTGFWQQVTAAYGVTVSAETAAVQ